MRYSANARRKHGLVYICHFCQSHYEQPFGRVVEKITAKGNTQETFKFISGPAVGEHCPQCASNLTVSSCGLGQELYRPRVHPS